MLIARAISRGAESKAAISQAEAASDAREARMAEAQAAERKAREAAENAEKKSGLLGVLKTVATVAAVVAVAASVCTGGLTAPAALALVGVALSVSAPVVAEATGCEKLGMGMAIAGAACSLGSAGISAFSSTATIAANSAASGSGAAGAAAGGAKTAATATNAASAAAEGAKTTSTVATAVRITGGTAQVVSGGATVARGCVELSQKADVVDAERAKGSAKMARAAAKQEEQILDDAIAMLSKIEKSARRAIGSVMKTVDDEDRMRTQVISNLAGRA
jgi:hypothetical protein